MWWCYNYEAQLFSWIRRPTDIAYIPSTTDIGWHSTTWFVSLCPNSYLLRRECLEKDDEISFNEKSIESSWTCPPVWSFQSEVKLFFTETSFWRKPCCAILHHQPEVVAGKLSKKIFQKDPQTNYKKMPKDSRSIYCLRAVFRWTMAVALELEHL